MARKSRSFNFKRTIIPLVFCLGLASVSYLTFPWDSQDQGAAVFSTSEAIPLVILGSSQESHTTESSQGLGLANAVQTQPATSGESQGIATGTAAQELVSADSVQKQSVPSRDSHGITSSLDLQATAVTTGPAMIENAKEIIDPSGLRFYVHRLPKRFDPETLIKKHPKCSIFQWSNDFKFLRHVQGGMATEDPEKADFFFVPFLSKCYFNFEAVYHLSKMEQDFSTMMDAVEATLAWKRWPDRHLFIFSSGAGPTLVPSWQKVRHGIFILAEGDRSAGFYDSSRDIVIPGVGKATQGKANTKELHRPRELLATFRGTLIRGHARDEKGKDVYCRSLLRQALLNLAEGRRDVAISERRYTDDKGTLDKTSYKKELASSTFCIIPRGLTPWTSRLFDAIALDCIPVILSNAIVFPYERSIDYSRFTIKLPESWVSRLWTLLESIPKVEVRALQMRVREAAPKFVGKGPIGGVLSELAKVRLGGLLSVNHTRNSANTFWMPGRGIFELHGNEAQQVGPSYSAGAHPHPEESKLWVPDEAFKKLVGKLWHEENCVPCPKCKYGQWGGIKKSLND